MKKHLFTLVVFVYFIANVGFTQQATIKTFEKTFPIDDTSYELNYTIPAKESIVEVLEKLYNQINTSTPFKVINRVTGEVVTDFSKPDSNVVVDTRTGPFNLWDYTVGVIHTGMFAVGETLNDPKYLEYPVKNYDFIFKHLPYFRERAKLYGVEPGTFHRIINMEALDHCGSIGAALVQALKYKKSPEYLAMLDTVSNYILNRQFRLDDGTLARERPQKVSVWADDFYMSVPFLARMGEYTGDSLYFNDAVRQVLQMSERLFQWDKKLFDHGWNQCSGEFDPKVFWARANGWAMMAMATLLDVLPENYPGRDSVLTIYKTHVQGVTEVQGGNGTWHNLLDRVDTYSETSSTAMFVYAMAKGVNEGWIDHTFGAVAQAGWNGLCMFITPEGKIDNMCAGTTFAPDMVYYYHRPPSYTATHGFGPALMAGAEMIRLIENPELKIINQHRTYHYRKTNE